MRVALLLVLPALLLGPEAHAGEPARGTLSVTAAVGPTCPFQRVDQPCEDRPYTGALRVRGRHRTWFLQVRRGHGHITLPAGRYTLSKRRLPYLAATRVVVRAGRTTRRHLHLDSGI